MAEISLQSAQSAVVAAVSGGLGRPVTEALIKQLARLLPRRVFLRVSNWGGDPSDRLLIKESLLPGVVGHFYSLLAREGYTVSAEQIERILRSAGMVVLDTEPSLVHARVEEHSQLCQEDFDARVAGFRVEVMSTLMKDLHTAGTNREKILEVARSAFRMLGIAGVNVYLYDEPTEHLLCLQSEQMLGKSRYDRSQGKSAWKPAEGAKAYILGKEDGCYVIADRFNINTWGAEPGDSSVSAFFDQERVKGMADAALYKQQGEGIEDGKKNVREEVYIKVKGANGHTYLFVGNSHLRNVQEGYKPLFADVPGGEETVRTICDDISGLIGKSLQGAFMRTRLEVRSHQLEAVNVLSRRLDEAISAEGATGSIPQLVGTALPVIFKRLTRASIIVWDPATGTYQIAAAWGQGYHPERVYDPDGFSFTDWVLSTRRTFSYSIRDPGNRAKIPVALRQRPFYERGDFMVVPFYGREVSGVIAITSEMRRYLTPDDQATLEQIALHLATKMDNEQLIKELRYLAEHDVMTGLWNKKVGLGQLAGLFLSPAPRPPITVIGVDLDHFKWVNDTYGHIAGDKVLIELGRRMERAAEEKIVTILGRQMTTLTEQQLRAEAQKICTVMRYGGEEFAIILNGLDHSEGLEVADAVGEAIRATPFDIGGGSQVSRTASLGVASTSQFSFASPDALYYAADTACYAAKNPDTVTLEQEGEVVPFGAAGSGRNRVVLWVAGMCKVEAA